MKFSYDRAWADIVAMARGHVEILLVLAGVFLMLPVFAQSVFLPQPEIKAFDSAAWDALAGYFRANWLALLVLRLPVWLGSAAIMTLLLDARRPTVGQALSGALPLLAGVVIADWLTQLMVFAGLLLLIVPGLYLIGRVIAALPAQMAERIANPLTAIARSFAITRSNGWRLVGIVVIFVIVGTIMVGAVGSVIGILLSFVVPAEVLHPVVAFVTACLSALFTLSLLLLAASAYRQLVPSTGT